MHEMGCEIERKSEEMQAYYQCEHGIWAFNDKTEDCYCQTQYYKTNLKKLSNQTVATINQTKETKLKTTERGDSADKTRFSTQTLGLNMENKNSDSNS